MFFLDHRTGESWRRFYGDDKRAAVADDDRLLNEALPARRGDQERRLRCRSTQTFERSVAAERASVAGGATREALTASPRGRTKARPTSSDDPTSSTSRRVANARRRLWTRLPRSWARCTMSSRIRLSVSMRSPHVSATRVAAAVDAMTRRRGEDYETSYLARCEGRPDRPAWSSGADSADNLARTDQLPDADDRERLRGEVRARAPHVGERLTRSSLPISLAPISLPMRQRGVNAAGATFPTRKVAGVSPDGFVSYPGTTLARGRRGGGRRGSGWRKS